MAAAAAGEGGDDGGGGAVVSAAICGGLIGGVWESSGPATGSYLWSVEG